MQERCQLIAWCNVSGLRRESDADGSACHPEREGCTGPWSRTDRGRSTGRRQRLAERGLGTEFAARGQPAPVAATERWLMERTIAWITADEKRAWCAQRRRRVVKFSALIIVSFWVGSWGRAGRTTSGMGAHGITYDLWAQALGGPHARGRVERRANSRRGQGQCRDAPSVSFGLRIQQWPRWTEADVLTFTPQLPRPAMRVL